MMTAIEVGRVILGAPFKFAQAMQRRLRDKPPYLLIASALALNPLGATEIVPDSPKAIQAELKSFATYATVLHVAAHPDDENRSLLAYLSRIRNYRTGYLSITRGDGGQNEIGSEFGEKLGLARTQELLAGRRFDGARQFFTRAVDFGYSKSIDEALSIWDRKEVLGDVVRVIRQFRPDVIITRFTPQAQPGNHGHHNASALLALEAFKLAGDPQAFPEQIAEGLKPWQPVRILQPGANGVEFTPAGNDPVTGESVQAIVAHTSAQHKTQFGPGFGVGRETRRESYLVLAGEPAKDDIMDGIDLTWSRVPGGAEIGRLAEEAIAQFKIEDPSASVSPLLAIRAKLATLPPDPVVADKRAQLDRILQACLGLSVETTLPNAEVVPGEALALHHTANVTSKEPIKLVTIRYPAAKGGESVNAMVGSDQMFVRDVSTVLPLQIPISQPYWLREDAAPGLFRVDDRTLIGRPENPPAFPVEFVFSVGGQTLVVATEPVQIVKGAPAAQQRRRLTVIPPVSLGFPYEVELFHLGATKTTIVEATAARANTAGVIKLTAPAGWKISPASQPFQLAKVGDKTRVTFTVTAPAQTASGKLAATAEVGKGTYSAGRAGINYAHLPVLLLQPPARLKVAAFEFATRGLNIGYLPGSGDNTVENLEQLGYLVTTLRGTDLTPERLRGFDAVVIGVRAFNERTDMAANIAGLFAYVENGGTVIAQYNRPDRTLRTSQLGPYSLSIAGSVPQNRVTDENAPVTFLAPDHPALNAPNKISATDFNGWVQERGTYFPTKWDEHYTPIFAISDPGEKQPDSSLLVAKHGKGYYVYAGLAFFRQLPAGVPGAYRLFANLVSLGK